MNDIKAEEVVALSDEGDAGEDNNGTVSPAPITVPKKRGRPLGPEKPKKIPSGRGRGRPAKLAHGGNQKPVKAATSAEVSEQEETASDDGSPLPNGDKVAAVPSKRGRRPKLKRKLTHTVESTNKGRGRPKQSKTEAVDEEEAADDDEESSVDHKPVKKVTAKAGKKGRGRPKKSHNSDESSDDIPDDEVARRPVGRPPSGAINLNIGRTERGQGRPKKELTARRATAADQNGGEKIVKKLGRPVTTGKRPYSPTGKPRGRPKLVAVEKDSQEDEEEHDEGEENSKRVADQNSADDGDHGDEVDNKAKSEGSDDGI